MSAQLRDAVLVFDVGGTDTKVGIADIGASNDGRTAPLLRDIRRIPTRLDPEAPAESLVASIHAELEAVRAAEPELNVVGLGLAVPGLVDDVAGVGILAANLGWRNFAFREALEQATQLPVYFGHDVATAAEAERGYGAAAGSSDALVLIIGTGIAGTYFCDGQRLRAGGFAGEVGHAQVPHPDGGFVILEELSSASGIARRYQQAKPEVAQLPAFGAREVFAAADSGDTLAQRVLDEGIQALALMISHSVAMLGTRDVVIGGGLAQAADALFVPLRAAVDALLTFQPRPRLIPASLGEDAGVIGCAMKTIGVVAARSAGQ